MQRGNSVLIQNNRALSAALLLIVFCTNNQAEELSEITITSARVANDSPASSYASPATALRFDPLTELQSRGLPEGQADVTVRGSLFENTGFKLGAITITDPQTGHYVAELPLDPALMTSPEIYTGIDSAIEGFNSSVATIAYGISKVSDGGALRLGAGSDDLNYQMLRVGKIIHNDKGNTVGVALSAARSEGDGSVEFGDHEFSRFNLQLQHATASSQSDLIVGYQDKFYGWPGAYTGFASLPEIDDTQTTLVLANHRRELGTGWIELGSFYRHLDDDYDFNRTTQETGVPGSFEHETRVIGFGLQGLHQIGRISWRYGGQFTSDKLVRSTDLTSGDFRTRKTASFSLVPSFTTDIQSGELTWRFGATLDSSDRDSNIVSPLIGVTLRNTDAKGSTEYSLEYAATSQVPGYTALKSGPTGLFGGNADLGREKARQLSASFARYADGWQFQATLFGREDDNLVDWTYATGSPFARQANAVDIDVIGFEAFYTRNWPRLDLTVGYTILDKDSDYGDADVDASFYALNFARQRGTLAIVYRLGANFELQLDNEYRKQQHNPLRVGDNSAFLASASLRWSSPGERRFGAALVMDNVTDSEYQPFPGTPASGRQVSLSVSYLW